MPWPDVGPLGDTSMNHRRGPRAGAGRMATAAACGTLALLVVGGAQARSAAPRGVDPSDIVTKVDLLFKRDDLSGDVSITSWTLKYDLSLDSRWGVSAEIPYAEFRDGRRAVRGMSESKFKVRYVANQGRLSWVAGGEAVAPTARDPRLGSGTWQLNPSFGAVWSVSPTVFLFGGLQHLKSLHEDHGRDAVRQNQVRGLVARVSPAGWWLLGDAKYTRDLVARTDGLDLEVEYGRMFGASQAFSLRLGTSALDSQRDIGVVGDFRILF